MPVNPNEPLMLDHGRVSCREVHLMGLQLKVYGLDEIKDSKLPIAGVFALHGRGGSQVGMETFCHGMLGEISRMSGSKEKQRDVIAITMDQRNHGTRLLDRKSNLSYDQNSQHLVDMAACILGGTQDVSFVISVLNSYLFPNGEREVKEWIASGHSLGANVTWRVLREEPRISIAIPLQGLPLECHLPYLRARAEGMNLSFSPPLYPPALKPLLETPAPKGIYSGKRILTVHGGADEVVPYRIGKETIDGISAEAKEGGGEVKVEVLEGVGHTITPEMVKLTAEWVYRYTVQSSA